MWHPKSVRNVLLFLKAMKNLSQWSYSVLTYILIFFQVLGTLFIYVLFMVEEFRKEPVENMDDVIYYVNGTYRLLEFLVALCVVAYGVSETIFGEWTVMGSMIIFIHSYYNVWLRAQLGWKSFLLRRDAVNKIKSLPIATKEQLEKHNDICAICYQVTHSKNPFGWVMWRIPWDVNHINQIQVKFPGGIISLVWKRKRASEIIKDLIKYFHFISKLKVFNLVPRILIYCYFQHYCSPINKGKTGQVYFIFTPEYTHTHTQIYMHYQIYTVNQESATSEKWCAKILTLPSGVPRVGKKYSFT